jgi:hypothetical protein
MGASPAFNEPRPADSDKKSQPGREGPPILYITWRGLLPPLRSPLRVDFVNSYFECATPFRLDAIAFASGHGGLSQ